MEEESYYLSAKSPKEQTNFFGSSQGHHDPFLGKTHDSLKFLNSRNRVQARYRHRFLESDPLQGNSRARELPFLPKTQHLVLMVSQLMS